VREKYPDDVKVVFKNFPIRSHRFSLKAAVAAMAAGRQNKFWEFHDALFKNHRKLSAATIKEIAHTLGLDEAKFEKQVKNPAIIDHVSRDYREGEKLGVRGTPTVFINGRRVHNRSMQNMEALIEKELKTQAKEKKVP
jgi:protein-disulfide isomerase